MKTNASPLLLVPLLSLLGACGHHATDDPTPASGSGEVRWTVAGTQYVARAADVQVQAHYRPSTMPGATATQKDVLILADDGRNYQVSVLLANFTGTGTYQLQPAGYSIGGLTELTGSRSTYSTLYSANSAAGTVEVSSFDANTLAIKGTFTFNARVRNAGGTFGPATDVSQGSFDLKSMIRY